jgi:hypothetical protein
MPTPTVYTPALAESLPAGSGANSPRADPTVKEKKNRVVVLKFTLTSEILPF